SHGSDVARSIRLRRRRPGGRLDPRAGRVGRRPARGPAADPLGPGRRVARGARGDLSGVRKAAAAGARRGVAGCGCAAFRTRPGGDAMSAHAPAAAAAHALLGKVRAAWRRTVLLRGALLALAVLAGSAAVLILGDQLLSFPAALRAQLRPLLVSAFSVVLAYALHRAF